ncbi:MAG TPA: hypothetical protein VNJ03_04240 [Vicinamibacterales bacterium]|nr:hypothetical protein [Vicinamibacterales bacterium]
MRQSQKVSLSICLALLVLAAACKAKTPNETNSAPGVRVTDVTLGRSIGGDKSISDRTENFKPNDTIYASVATDGASSATLRAKWLFEDGQVVDESTHAIAANNRERTEFHISKPNGWPAGKYKLEVFLNDQSVETKNFDVR